MQNSIKSSDVILYSQVSSSDDDVAGHQHNISFYKRNKASEKRYREYGSFYLKRHKIYIYSQKLGYEYHLYDALVGTAKLFFRCVLLLCGTTKSRIRRYI